MTVFAELHTRHTRRHMPTRRVAVEGAYVPTTGAAHGLALLSAVVAANVGYLDEEQAYALSGLLRVAAAGELTVPRVALRYRLQTDTHGLDRSRHRVVAAGHRARTVLELDVHGAPVPQLIGAVMAASALPPTARRPAFSVIDRARRTPGAVPRGYEVRRITDGATGVGVPRAAAATRAPEGWIGVPTDRRWALEALGFATPQTPARSEVRRRFRRLLRAAHPDHGAERAGAAQRIGELSEARDLLLAWLDTELAASGR